MKAGDILILVRRREPFTAPMIRELKRAGSPVAGADRMRLMDQLAVQDLVALADDKRDLKLKNALLEQVRLVRFKPGHIEVNPLPVAAPDLLQELMRKLKAWTGRVWIVSTSDQEGAEPLGATRRAQAEREMEQLRAHPAVQEVLQHFPDARIAAVRSTAHAVPGEDAGNEAPPEEDLKDDGTN
ncbi:hypothetical protein AUC71_00785 [Methyloceanibacter marginalis]|uniref:DNA polymerase III subunit gamma/ tau C-terminal domain-containing protein n=1 Tax=Methyloceanibacter marginalis TaxID=1774971 RepID=A0A1E3WEV4_9HYPH|nr:hypothetical protein [Methyloceanibacter marginalis]ODS03567.1 hypothetical protein AUC71_00785 [Methyloceanibacter marginalis]